MEVGNEDRIGSEIHARISGGGGQAGDGRWSQRAGGGPLAGDVAKDACELGSAMSPKTLANWVVRARKGQALVKREQVRPVTELEAQVSRLRQENARLRLEKEILKKAAAYFAKESM